MVRCSRGLEVGIRTSCTNRNPSRRLYGCPTLSLTCVNFIQWFDPPMCQISVQIIPGLLRSCNELEESLVMGYSDVDECGFELIDEMNSFGC
ncbi:hypothetical protein Tco_1000841 [Tanacetum coccineum]